MHGLIWGIVHLDGRKAAASDCDRLTKNVHSVASIGACSSDVSGPAALCRADLWPIGADSAPDSGPFLKTESISAAVEGRLFDYDENHMVPAFENVATSIAARDIKSLGALHGDFAVAVWDNASGRLTLARDILGVRPLFFAHRPDKFVAFCSLSDPLIRAGFASTDRNLKAIAELMTWSFGRGTSTLLADVHRVPAAHLVQFEAGHCRVQSYWQPSDIKTSRTKLNAEQAARHMKQLMSQAVFRRVPKQGMAATHCSGGLDSATITKLAADQMAVENRGVLAGYVSSVRQEDVDSIDHAGSVEALRQQNPNIEITRTQWPSAAELMLADYRCDRPMSDHWAQQWQRFYCPTLAGPSFAFARLFGRHCAAPN